MAEQFRELKTPGDMRREAVRRSRSALWAPSMWWQGVLAGALALMLGLGVLEILRQLAHPLSLLVLGIAIAAGLSPLVGSLERRLPRLLSIVLVYLVLVMIIMGIGLVVVPALVYQGKQVGTQVPELVRQVSAFLDRYSYTSASTPSLADMLAGPLSSFTGLLVALPINIVTSIFDIVLVIFISIYWLLAAPGMRSFLLSLFPAYQRDWVDHVMVDIGKAMGGYIRASLLNGLIIGVLAYLGLLIIGVDFPIVLGLLAGVMELIPVLGPVLSGAVIVGFALLQSPGMALIALIFMVAMQQLEGHILVPNIMRTQTDISPLLAVMALVAGATMGGLLGAVIAIPLVGAALVIVREVIAPTIRHWSGAEEID